MRFKPLVTLNIAIIGNGKIAEVLATKLALGGHNICIGLKEGEKFYDQPLFDTFTNMQDCSIEDAGSMADLVIIAVPPKDVREVAYWLGDMKGKVIVDMTSTYFYDLSNYINTVNAIKAISGTQHIVKCFSAVDYMELLPAATKDRRSIFVAGNSKKGKEVMRWLAADLDFDTCYDMGEEEAIASLEQMAMTWMNSVLSHEKVLVPVKKY
ncbi:MAG: NAD(P)-binding domain-containing protein [Bacteroidota bacterium]